MYMLGINNTKNEIPWISVRAISSNIDAWLVLFSTPNSKCCFLLFELSMQPASVVNPFAQVKLISKQTTTTTRHTQKKHFPPLPLSPSISSSFFAPCLICYSSSMSTLRNLLNCTHLVSIYYVLEEIMHPNKPMYCRSVDCDTLYVLTSLFWTRTRVEMLVGELQNVILKTGQNRKSPES